MFKRFLPTREGIVNSRMLRWLGPRLHDPLLWHMNRNAVARGVAIGAFFGFMIPVAQIPAAAIVALFSRANLWIAALSTLVSNPLTYGPIYYFAYRLGNRLLDPLGGHSGPPAPVETVVADNTPWLIETVQWLTGIGRPLILGMFIMACVAAVVGYFVVLLAWRIRVVIKRRRQRRNRLAGRGVARVS